MLANTWPSFLRLVIQGAVDVNTQFDQSEILRTLDFCLGALVSNGSQRATKEKEELVRSMRALVAGENGPRSEKEDKLAIEKAEALLTEEQLEYLNKYRKYGTDGFVKFDVMNLDGPSGFDVFDGYSMNLVTGELGLKQNL